MVSITELAPTRRTVVTGASLVAAVTTAGLLLQDRVPPLDRWIVSDLYAAPGSTVATVATAISGAGTLACLGVLLFVIVRRGFNWRYPALLVCCLAVIASQAVFQRSGPPVTAQDWTYPSGHAVFVTAFALTAVLISRSARVLAITASIVVLVSASRLVLGEHYLVDVVAAVAATVGVGLLAAAFLRLPSNAYAAGQ